MMKRFFLFLLAMMAMALDSRAEQTWISGPQLGRTQSTQAFADYSHRAGALSCDAYDMPESPLTSAIYPEEPIIIDHEISIWGGKVSKSRNVLPSVGNHVAPGRFPLVLLLHGRTFEYDEYTTIQKRLAANGIASVSMQYSKLHDESDYVDITFYEVFEKTLQSIFQAVDIGQNPLHGKVTNDVIILGHSLGGGLAVYAANRLVKEGSYPLTIRSVVALAPNPQVDFGWMLAPDVTQGVLVLFGSDDADPAVNTPANSGFYLYDQSGYLQNELTNFNPARAFIKSMVYIKGAGHDSFLDAGPAPYVETAAAYIVAFSRWALKNNEDYSVYFRKQASIGNDVTVSLLHSEPFRRVIDNFEDESATFNALGGKNTFSNLTAVQDLSLFNYDSPHYSQSLMLKWDGVAKAPVARFGLPMPLKVEVDYRDFSSFSHLSLRIGQMYQPGGNSGEFDAWVRIDYLSKGVPASQARRLSDFGKVPFPFAHKQASGTKSVMNTVTIPLCAYDDIDFHNALITGVGLEVSVPVGEGGAIQLDSLELHP